MSVVAVWKAVEQKDEQRVRELLDAGGCDPHVALYCYLLNDQWWDDPLHCPIVRWLIDRVDPTTDLVANALAIGLPTAARRLVDLGAPLPALWPALHRAAFFGDDDAVARLVLEDDTDVNYAMCSLTRWTALDVAVSCGHTATVKLLRDSGAEVDNKMEFGDTLLHKAARSNDHHTVRWLCANGADVNAMTDYGGTPMHAAAGNGHTDTVRWLGDQGADVNAKNKEGEIPMHTAAWNRYLDTVKELCDRGADVNAKNNDGYAPLHFAAVRCPSTAKWLLDKGADANAKNNRGFTPLHWAAVSGHTDTMKWLLDNGADVNAQDKNGDAPMHDAARNGHTDSAKWLRDNGADVKAKNEYGATPMHLAAEKGHTDTAKWLRDNGADVNAKDKRGDTPMHMAAENLCADIAKLLYDGGASVNAKDNYGNTPMHTLAWYRSTDTATARFLRCSGADVTAPNKEGKTPLDIARDRKNVDVVRVLETDRAELLFEEWAVAHRPLQAEAALVEVLGDVSAAMDGPTVGQRRQSPTLLPPRFVASMSSVRPATSSRRCSLLRTVKPSHRKRLLSAAPIAAPLPTRPWHRCPTTTPAARVGA